jgi:Zn-dependent protease
VAARSRRTCAFRYSTSASLAFAAFSTRFTAVRRRDRAARLRTFASRLRRTRFFALLMFGNSTPRALWANSAAQSIDETKISIKEAGRCSPARIPSRDGASRSPSRTHFLEVAHAGGALQEGDDTAQSLGRITLNPVSHLDPFGSFLVPMALYFFANGVIFGWAKPVPIEPRKVRNFRRGDIRVSLAGIVSNLILAVAFTLLTVVFIKLQSALPTGESTLGFLIRTARFGIFINLILAVFNLVPIPPLDGSHVLYHFLPRTWRATYQQAGRYGILILIVLASVYPPFFGIVLSPVFALLGLADTFIELWI